MPIDTRCPQCQAKLRIGDEYAGQQARCPLCDTIYLVPEASVSSAPETMELASAIEPASALSSESAVVSTADVNPAESTTATLAAPSAQPAVVAADPLPPPDGTRWYLRTPEGPIYGPTSPETFHRWVEEGRVTPDCEVCAGDNLWRPAAEQFPQISAGRTSLARPIQPDSWSPALRPHRGTLILVLGLMAIITTCPLPGVMAWVMGTSDLLDMQNGRMDPSGQSATQGGRILGMILTLIYVGAAVIGTFVVLLLMARG